MPLVSAIIPVCNRARLVAEAVTSVLDQTHRLIEVVVVDDASDDGTPDQLRRLAARHPDIVRVVRRSRTGGPGAAREDGRRIARGSYIQYLDSDDRLHPTKFERQVAALERDPRLGLVYGDSEFVTVVGDRVRRRRTLRAPALDRGFPALLLGRPWRTVAPLYRRSVVDRAGLWLPIWNEEDWEYDARVCSLGIRVRSVEGVVGTEFRRVSGHLSGLTRHRRRCLASQAIARPRILRHAIKAGVATSSAEFQHAVRHLFLLARQCGSAGLTRVSASLLRDVVAWTVPTGRADVVLFRRLARMFGERPAGVAAASFDRARSLWRR